MKILTRDDTEHGVEYVTRADAEREIEAWKASHDNQVELKRIIAARPDLAERAPMVEQLIRERDEACKILDDIDEIFHTMRPRWHQTPSMCGRYPCWIVWLPKEGTCERKTLKEAVIEFAAQTLILPENAKCGATEAKGTKS